MERFNSIVADPINRSTFTSDSNSLDHHSFDNHKKVKYPSYGYNALINSKFANIDEANQ